MIKQNFAVIVILCVAFHIVPKCEVVGGPLGTHLPLNTDFAENELQQPQGEGMRMFFGNFDQQMPQFSTQPGDNAKEGENEEDDNMPIEQGPTTQEAQHIAVDEVEHEPPAHAGTILAPEETQTTKEPDEPEKEEKGPTTAAPKIAARAEEATTTPKELTISIPKFIMDEGGHWVHNPWAVTYGKVWQDTRFNVGKRFTIPRMKVDSTFIYNYHQQSRPQVCKGRSTVYNRPPIKKYLKRNVYNHTHAHRPIFMDLRREIFKNGNSEECHVPDQIEWRKYHECFLRRNQRMEYMIPRYPLHQYGYRGYYWGNE